MSDALSSVQTPDLAALLRMWRELVFTTFNCHQIGSVVSFDKDAQTAQVALSVLRVVGEQTVAYPLLVDVPVFFARGGTASLRFPVTAGDPCLVAFNDRDMDNWFDAGATAVPNSTRAHSLADGLAFVGFSSKANPLASFSDSAAELVNAGGKFAAKNDGNLSATSAAGGFIEVESKVNVANGSGTLKAAVDALCAALTSWIDTGGQTPNPATVAAINAAKSLFDNILK